jgi:hypothetical protein
VRADCSEILDVDGIRQIGVCMPRANVVVAELFDRGEGGNTHFVERHVVRAPDAVDDVAPRAEITQRLEPRIEDRLHRGFSSM